MGVYSCLLKICCQAAGVVSFFLFQGHYPAMALLATVLSNGRMIDEIHRIWREAVMA
jgi:hypothetical protein